MALCALPGPPLLVLCDCVCESETCGVCAELLGVGTHYSFPQHGDLIKTGPCINKYASHYHLSISDSTLTH